MKSIQIIVNHNQNKTTLIDLTKPVQKFIIENKYLADSKMLHSLIERGSNTQAIYLANELTLQELLTDSNDNFYIFYIDEKIFDTFVNNPSELNSLPKKIYTGTNELYKQLRKLTASSKINHIITAIAQIEYLDGL